jgi:hypothetical protein
MGRTSSTSFVALKSALVGAVLLTSLGYARAEETPAPKSASKSPPANKHYSRFAFDVGVMMWTEKVHFSNSTSGDIPVNSNATGLAVNGDWRSGGASTGLVYQAGIMYGNITNQADSSTIIYQKGRDRTYGAQGAVGYYYRIPKSRAEISLLGEVRLRKVDHTVPPGYSFGKDDMIVAGFGKFDITIPIAKPVVMFQQFSIPITDKRIDTTWVIGVRI